MLFITARRRQIKARVCRRRCFALEYLGNQRIRWECKEGHRFTTTQIPAVSEALLKRFCEQPRGYWARANGGANVCCPQYLKDELKNDSALQQALERRK